MTELTSRAEVSPTLGIDLMSFDHWPYQRGASLVQGQPIINSALEQFALKRLAIVHYHDAVF